MTLSITQLCSETESLSAPLLFVCLDSNVSSPCLSCFCAEPSCDSLKRVCLQRIIFSKQQNEPWLVLSVDSTRCIQAHFVSCLSTLPESYWQIETDRDGLNCFCTQSFKLLRLLGRFCLSQHCVAPLIWRHFKWLHPGWLPVQAQRGRWTGGPLGWQDAGSVTSLGGSS